MAETTTEKKPRTPLSQKMLSAVRSFQKTVDATIAEREPASGPLAQGAVKPGASKSIKRHMEAFAWSKSAVTWIVVALVIETILVAVIFIGAVAAGTRPEGMVRGVPSIKDRADKFLSEDFEATRRTMDIFIHTSLSLIHNFDYKGPKNRLLLRGIVHPDILTRAEDQYRATLDAVQKNMVVQSLHIDKIGSVVYDAKLNRVSAYVSGYFVINMLAGKNGNQVPLTIPYRARVTMEGNIPGKLNPEHFYMLELKERIGTNAPKWDAEQKDL